MNFRSAVLVLIAIGISGVALAAVGNGTNGSANPDGIPFKPPGMLTREDLQKIYERYNVSENDIKFAEGKLPYYLNGTVLDGSKKIIVTDTGKIPKSEAERLKKMGINYTVMSWDEVRKISERAREKYIKKYGVDPANPKVVIVQGVPLPREYVRELVTKGILKPGSPYDAVKR